MRSAFTLIELLVVLVIITLVMGVVIPKGAKMLSSYQHSLSRVEEKQNLSNTRANAFLEAKDFNLTQGKKKYIITKKGVIVEISNDNY